MGQLSTTEVAPIPHRYPHFVTVSEFAALHNVTPHGVRKRLKTPENPAGNIEVIYIGQGKHPFIPLRKNKKIKFINYKKASDDKLHND